MGKRCSKEIAMRASLFFVFTLFLVLFLVPSVFAAPVASAASSTPPVTFTNPLSGISDANSLFLVLLTYLRNIVVLIALVIFVFGAVRYIASAGNDSMMTGAKDAMWAAAVGMAIAIAAPTFLKEIGNILGWDVSNTSVASAPTLAAILTKTLKFLLSITGILAIIMIVVGGLMNLTSAGDEERAKAGTSVVKYAVIGLICVFAALLLLQQIAKLFDPTQVL